MHICPWCSTSYAQWQNKCDQCGGSLAPPPGEGLGPKPPDAPRTLPKRYERRVKWTENISTMAGIIFAAVGSILFAVFVFVNIWMSLFPAFFAFGGICLFRLGWKKAKGILFAYKYGKVAEGRIHKVSLDATQSVNNVHPWLLVYHFPVGDQIYEGTLSTFDSTVELRTPGQPLWVLFNAADPAESAIFPPLA